jgi:hypothetical protein
MVHGRNVAQRHVASWPAATLSATQQYVCNWVNSGSQRAKASDPALNTTAATDLQSTVKIYMAIGQSRPVVVVNIFVAAQLAGQIATKSTE